jgi:hypothetical protein
MYDAMSEERFGLLLKQIASDVHLVHLELIRLNATLKAIVWTEERDSTEMVVKHDDDAIDDGPVD